MTQAEAVIRAQMETNVTQWLERKRAARGGTIVALPGGDRQVRPRYDMSGQQGQRIRPAIDGATGHQRAAWRKSA